MRLPVAAGKKAGLMGPGHVERVAGAMQAGGTGTEGTYRGLAAAFVDLGSKTGAVAVSFAAAVHTRFAAAGDCAVTFSGLPATGSALWLVEIAGGGDHTITWPAAVTWDGGAPPPLAAGTAATWLVFATRDGGTHIAAGPMFLSVGG
ncbi:hypothetical protein HL658_36235 [Azospirillum sp. RWY-5-1]|uniref:Uncharacterized protein n=1 Tax=Azospirillum oleiclasticum TaxID=2735135 RepID=A0ABX2TLD3_9PROT|nr:hypothetical protein [Azospirillum oleiclasticum]NYZ18017.1 hypothetical protein [Azospirillum oleiclasticum]NYZ25172.1 hypothetical protein [Azospirillum oleiclasticum]